MVIRRDCGLDSLFKINIGCSFSGCRRACAVGVSMSGVLGNGISFGGRFGLSLDFQEWPGIRLGFRFGNGISFGGRFGLSLDFQEWPGMPLGFRFGNGISFGGRFGLSLDFQEWLGIRLGFCFGCGGRFELKARLAPGPSSSLVSGATPFTPARSVSILPTGMDANF